MRAKDLGAWAAWWAATPRAVNKTLSGCGQCGRLLGPCCNTVLDPDCCGECDV